MPSPDDHQHPNVDVRALERSNPSSAAWKAPFMRLKFLMSRDGYIPVPGSGPPKNVLLERW
jgi:hypothetical protein